MRFSLRNQKKIEKAYSPAILKRIMESLKEEFKKGVIRLEDDASTKYKMLAINDTGHTCGLIIFYVLSVTFDVYNLAFKEFVN